MSVNAIDRGWHCGSTWFYQIEVLPRLTLCWDQGLELVALEWLFWTVYWTSGK